MLISDMKEKQAKLVTDMRELNDLAGKEDRAMTDDESEKYNKMEADFDVIGKDVADAEKADAAKAARNAKLEEREAWLADPANQAIKPGAGDDGDDGKENRKTGRASDDYRDAFSQFLIGGRRDLNDGQLRTLQADSDTQGGFTVATKFIADLIMELDNMVFVRPHATVIPLKKAASVGYPALDNDPADPIWTAEIKTGDEDSTMSFDARSLTPHPLAKRIKVSKDFIQVSSIGIDALVRSRLAYKFGTVEENAFLNGDGVNKPLGVFTASNDGISTSRDVATNNTGTAIKADGLIDAVYALKAQYRVGCRWAFHRDAVKMIRKLKDGNGQYLWQMGLQAGEPASILGYPLDESEYIPNTFTTGLYVGILADWRQYWIADALDMAIQVLTELYAETNQNGYIGRKETDAMPVDENAFVRVTLA